MRINMAQEYILEASKQNVYVNRFHKNHYKLYNQRLKCSKREGETLIFHQST